MAGGTLRDDGLDRYVDVILSTRGIIFDLIQYTLRSSMYAGKSQYEQLFITDDLLLSVENSVWYL
ncbi:hypothetical protein BPOR_1036g00040 [Botrytis porri]|uniref:Uncharacterized protein n=1 Tax=Botrytis porri TaxID=87229 RepID=A0A4Z1KC26_9HELO|nr:hypothetical protein BPOR_1036g00040 [Botrytis porri]